MNLFTRFKAWLKSRVHLVDNAGAILKWSFTALTAYVGAIFGALDLGYDQLMAVLPSLKEVIPDWQYLWVSFLCNVFIPLLRVFKQVRFSPPPMPDLIITPEDGGWS